MPPVVASRTEACTPIPKTEEECRQTLQQHMGRAKTNRLWWATNVERQKLQNKEGSKAKTIWLCVCLREREKEAFSTPQSSVATTRHFSIPTFPPQINGTAQLPCCHPLVAGRRRGSLTGHCRHSPEFKKKTNRCVVHVCARSMHSGICRSWCHVTPTGREEEWRGHHHLPSVAACGGATPGSPVLTRAEGKEAGVRGRKQPASQAGRGGASWEKPVVGFRRPYTRLYSFKFSCRMVSLTAANTNLMFSVSVAHVK